MSCELTCMKQIPRLVTAFAMADDACASDLTSKASDKPVTAGAKRLADLRCH